MAKSNQPAERVAAGIGDVIESLRTMRESIATLRILPQKVELAQLRGATPAELVEMVKAEIKLFDQSLTPEEAE